MDLFYRISLWLAYRLLLAFWWLTRPDHEGALVAIWVGGRILVVRTSYRGNWQLPGGGIKSGETSVKAAVRECQEELGLVLEPSGLVLEQEATHFREFRSDHTFIYAVRLSNEPPVKIDYREIVEARFVMPEDARILDIPEHLQQYLSTPSVIRRHTRPHPQENDAVLPS